MTDITIKSKIIFTFLVIILILFGLYFFKKEEITNDISFSEDETIVYLGDDHANNEILFIFDYSCSWCHHWIYDIFPAISNLIKENKVKFRTQSLALLDSASLELTKLDQQIKAHYPDHYFDIFWKIIEDGKDTNYTALIEDQYIQNLITSNQLDPELLLDEPSIDVIDLTDLYKNNLALASVPTIIVNGEKVNDPFDFNEIKDFLQ